MAAHCERLSNESQRSVLLLASQRLRKGAFLEGDSLAVFSSDAFAAVAWANQAYWWNQASVFVHASAAAVAL